MKKSILLSLLFLLWGIGINAQVSIYGFNSLSGTYTEVTGGTLHGTNANDDETFDALNIGFNFTYNGVSYSQVSISSNGFISFGATVLSSYTAISDGATSNNVVAANNHDLQAQTNAELRSELLGTAPNQVLVIQWKNYRHWNGTGDNYNFQIRLSETSNVIEIVYGAFTQGTTSRTAQVGLRGASNADFLNRATTTNWSSTTAGTLNSSTCTLSSTVFPASGLIYRFTPPLPCVTPGDGPSALVLTPASTSISGSFTPYPAVDSYIVIYSTTTPLTQVPVNGNTYTGGATLGNGTVSGYTNTNTFNVTGLSASTHYYLFIFSTNLNCTGGPLYNEIKPLVGNTTTLISNPVAFIATGLDGSTVTFAATPNVANNDIMVIWNQSSTFGIPSGTYITGDVVAGGGTVYYSGPAAGITNQTSLNPQTIYYYKAFSVSGTQYSGGIEDSAKTKCGNVALPWSENFSVFPPDCWARTIGTLAAPTTMTGTSTSWIADGFGNVGTTGSAKINIWSTTKKDWLITPSIDLGSGATNYQLEFDLALTDYASVNPITSDPNGTTGIDDKFAVVISTDNGTTWSSANTLRLWDNASSPNVYNNISATGEHITINLSAYTGVVKIGFYGESTLSNADNDLFIDNISLYDNVLPPACATLIGPVDATIDIALNTTISWNGVVGANSYDLYLGTNAIPPFFHNQAGTIYQPTPALLPSTTYYWKVVPKNAIGDATGCAEWSFTTGTQLIYCNSTATNTADDDIGNVTFAGINNGVATPVTPNPASVNLYTDFTAVTPAQVIAGGTYPISISQINTGTVYGCLVNVYIDVNNNGIFDTNEKLFTAPTSSTLTTVTGNVVIPANAFIGTTRMRVVLDESDIAPACGTYSYGETEDYLVTIVAPPLPVADFSANNTTPITNQTVTFTDLTTNFPTTWVWSFTPSTVVYTGGTTAASKNPQVQFTAAGTYTAQLIASNITGSNTVIKTDYIVVSDPSIAPIADFVASSLNLNTNITDTLTDLSTNTPTSWAWTITPGTFNYVAGTNANSQNPHIQFTAAGIYSVELVATNGAGSNTMTKTDYITVTLNYCTSNATSIADEEILNVTFGSLNNSSTCTTTGGAGSILNEYSNYTGVTAPTVVQSSTVSFSVQIGTCGGTYSNGCAIWIDYNQNGSFNDVGEKVYFSAATTTGAHIESGNIVIPATTSLGLTRMRVIVSESSVPTNPCGTYSWGETEDYFISIAPMVSPIADFSANDVTPIVNQTITISDLTQNNPTSWQWYILPNNPGDFDYMNATTATSQNPQIRFNVAGTWDVALKANNLAGSDSIMKLAYITASIPTQEPLAGFVASNLNPNSLETVVLTDTSLYTPTSWVWSFTPSTVTFVDGTTATDQNPHVILDAEGQYTVQLIAINGAGDDTATYTNYITVTSVIVINNGSETTCDGSFYDSGLNSGQYLNNEDYTMTVYPIVPTDKVRISFSSFNTESCCDYLRIHDGNTVAATQIGEYKGAIIPPVITSTAADGSLTFVWYSDGSVVGNGWEAMFSCFSPQPPDVNFIANDSTPFIDQTITLTDLSLHEPTSWQWYVLPNNPGDFDFVNTTTSTSQNPQIAFHVAGIWDVALKATNVLGSDSIMKLGYIVVSAPTDEPIAGFEANQLVASTNNDTITLQDTSLFTPTAWVWTITPNTFVYVNGTSATSQNPQVVFTTAGFYTVELYASNMVGGDTIIKANYIHVSLLYCASSANYIADEEIFNVTYGSLNNSSTCTTTGGTGSILNRYSDYTELSAPSIAQTVATPFSVTVASCGTTNYNSGLAIFIDLNQDGDFSDNGERVYSNGTAANIACIPQTIVTGTISIPITALPGTTRMRIIDVENTSGDAIDPCVAYGYGETEDYFVNISPIVPDAAFIADNVNPIVYQIVTLTDTSLNYPTSWNWSITPATFTYVNGTTATSQNPQVSFDAVGFYTVQLTATNVTGSDIENKADYINVTMPTNPPVAYFFADDITATTAQIITLTDTSAFIPTVWSWAIIPATFNFMNGTTANSQNPQVQFTAQGLYTVTLDATNAAGTGTLTKVDYIEVVGSTNMSNDTIVTCSSVIFDSGGQTGNYSDNEITTLTIQPATSGNVIQLVFSSFDVQPGWDYLNVYNGTGITGTLLGTFDSPVLPPTLISTASDGALTLQFTSDATTNATGWDAFASCIVPPVKSIAWSDTVFTEAVVNNGTIATVATLTLSNETFATSGAFTNGVEYAASNVPAGLSVSIAATNVSTVTVSLTGTAINHASADNINNLTINFLDAAFSGNNAVSIMESSKANLGVHYYDPLIVPNVVFTEIMYRSPATGSNDSLEYVELVNNGTAIADLSNYTFSGITFTIPNGTILNPGQYLVVAKNASAILNIFGATALQWNAGLSNNLNNNGEAVILKTFWGATVDSVFYGSTAPWPTQAAGNGSSITLCDPSSNNSLATSWTASASATTHIINAKVLTGSPGATDDACAPVDLTVVSPTGNFDYCNGTTHDTVIAIVQNVGSTSVGSGQVLHISYNIDGGAVVTENHTLTSPMTPGSQIQHHFAQTVDLSSVGAHPYKIFVKYILDNISGNDTSAGVATGLAVIADIIGGDTIHTATFPYTLNVNGSFDSYLWSNQNGSQTGTNATFSAGVIGWYHVTITNLNGCTDIDSVYVDNLVGTTLLSLNTKVYVYPNPAKEIFNIEVSMLTSTLSIELFSSEGRMVYRNEQTNINTYKGIINISNYAPGIYTLLINTGKDVYRKKLIVQ